MGNEQHGHSSALTQFGQQQHDLSLNGDIKGRGRFVGNQQFGLTRQCHGNHDTLLLATRQLMWISFDALLRFRDANFLKQVTGPLHGFFATDFFVSAQHFGQLIAHCVNRVQ